MVLWVSSRRDIHKVSMAKYQRKFEPPVLRRSSHGKMRLPDMGEYGPKIRALVPRMREFVLAYLNNGGNATRAYIAAGYGGTTESANKNAHKILYDERVQEALHEQSQKMYLKWKFHGQLILKLVNILVIS